MDKQRMLEAYERLWQWLQDAAREQDDNILHADAKIRGAEMVMLAAGVTRAELDDIANKYR